MQNDASALNCSMAAKHCLVVYVFLCLCLSLFLSVSVFLSLSLLSSSFLFLFFLFLFFFCELYRLSYNKLMTLVTTKTIHAPHWQWNQCSPSDCNAATLQKVPRWAQREVKTTADLLWIWQWQFPDASGEVLAMGPIVSRGSRSRSQYTTKTPNPSTALR